MLGPNPRHGCNCGGRMNPPKMPVHIGDYMRDTGHLRAAGHGAYLLLMFHYWATGSLPDDDEQLASIARMSKPEWRKHRLIVQAFFKDGWNHSRIDYELTKAANISKAAREAGKASGRSRSVKRETNGRSNGRSSPVEPTLEPLNHKKEEDTADAVSSSATSYAFESGIVRLSEEDFKKWEIAFPRLDLRAELTGLSEWANQQGSRWFFAVSGALNKRNRDIKTSIEKRNVSPQEQGWKEAIR